jgi:hypothetical protein
MKLGKPYEHEILRGEERENAAWLIYAAMQIILPSEQEVEETFGASLKTVRNWGTGDSVPPASKLKDIREFFRERGVALNFKKGTLSFDIKKAVEAGVPHRKAKRKG